MRTTGLLAVILLIWGLFGASAVARAEESEKILLDFNGFEKGERVSAVPHKGTDRMIRVIGINPRFSQNAAVVFDSSNPGAVDIDLGTPHRDFEVVVDRDRTVPGPGEGDGGRRGEPCQNNRPLGKLLIVDDDLTPLDDEGRVTVPNDEGRAGARLVIDFSEIGPVTIYDMAVVDVEEPDAVVWAYDVGMEERQKRPRRRQVLARLRFHTEDNGVAWLADPALRDTSEDRCHVTLEHRRDGQPGQPLEGVLCIETEFNGSGAIAGIVYSVSEPEELEGS
jgi:hypothetical protein